MNYTQSFEEFSTSLGPTDLALYAGVGVVLYVLFKDRLSPVQEMLLEWGEQVKEYFKSRPAPVVVPVVKTPVVVKNNEVFNQMVASWKQTRDLAAKYKCERAVDALDAAFPYLAPTTCGGNDE